MDMCVDTNTYIYVGRYMCVCVCVRVYVYTCICISEMKYRVSSFKSLFGPLLNKCPNFLTLSHLLVSPFPQQCQAKAFPHPDAQLVMSEWVPTNLQANGVSWTASLPTGYLGKRSCVSHAREQESTHGLLVCGSWSLISSSSQSGWRLLRALLFLFV